MFSKLKKYRTSLLLVAAALLLVAGGSVMGARAQLTIQSEQYRGDFELDHLAVALVENGVQTSTQDEQLLQHLDQKVQPGMVYQEEISAENTTDIDHFLRLTIRKYWMKDGEKDQTKDPSLIHLFYMTVGKFNEGPW